MRLNVSIKKMAIVACWEIVLDGALILGVVRNEVSEEGETSNKAMDLRLNDNFSRGNERL